MALRKRPSPQGAVSGVLWTVGGQGGQQVLQFSLALVLARLLTPTDFGLVGMVLVLSRFALLLAEQGMGAALVQREQLEERHLATAFWLTSTTAAGLAALFLTFAPAISTLFSEPELQPLVRAMAASLMIESLGIVPRALLQREASFRRIALVETSAHALGGGLAIVLAVAGAGPWSLIARAVGTATVTTVMLGISRGWTPHARPTGAAARELVAFSGHLTGFNVMNYWIRTSDDFLVGRFGGSAALGVYDRAYTLMLLPVSRVTGAVGQVMFPIMARMKQDLARSRTTYLRAIGLIALLTFPAMMGLWAVADHFILALLGEEWVDTIYFLRLFCMVGMVQSITSSTGWIYQAQGRTDLMLRWGAISGVATVSAFIIGIQWGAKGVAIAYVARSTALLYWSVKIPGRLIGVTAADVARSVLQPLLLAGAMTASVMVARNVIGGSALPSLLILSVGGASVYLGLVVAFKPAAYVDLRALLEQRSRESDPPEVAS